MATLTYQCPVEPTACPESSRPGFCDVHTSTRLERVRPGPAASQPAETEPEAEAVLAATGQQAVRILGQVLMVPPEGLLLGRDAAGTRSLPGLAGLLYVGREHARLFWHAGTLHVVDLGSQNGTFLDGQRVGQEPAPLCPGQVLNLAGDVDVLVVELDDFGLAR